MKHYDVYGPMQFYVNIFIFICHKQYLSDLASNFHPHTKTVHHEYIQFWVCLYE